MKAGQIIAAVAMGSSAICSIWDFANGNISGWLGWGLAFMWQVLYWFRDWLDNSSKDVNNN